MKDFIYNRWYSHRLINKDNSCSFYSFFLGLFNLGRYFLGRTFYQAIEEGFIPDYQLK